MDPQTLHTYHTNAERLCQQYRRTAPASLYQLIQRFFQPGQPTADIGCGSGRDVAWLVQQGYPTTGYDAVTAMLTQARHTYPHIIVQQAQLPYLSTIASQTYPNVLCNATLMHLPTQMLAPALANLARILQPGGRLIYSYRHSTAPTEREPDGRLFTHISSQQQHTLLAHAALQLLTSEQQTDNQRPHIHWHITVAQKNTT
ncbi:MAG: class I SAM-dependent methyltransferase [Chloroflexaceae bacterium]|nr:class I SAM-dependent methyltransferase [Chloroflexaceae bacterium]